MKSLVYVSTTNIHLEYLYFNQYQILYCI